MVGHDPGPRFSKPSRTSPFHRGVGRTKEAFARIKINKLLEKAGWRFFADDGKPANIRLESSVSIKSTDLDALGENFEKTARATSTSCCSTPRAFPLSSLRRSQRIRTRSSAKNRPANTPAPRTAASSFYPTATCTTFGIWSVATPTSSPPSRPPTRSSATRRSRPIRSASLRSRSTMTTSSSLSGRTINPKRRGATRPSVPAI